MTTPHSRRQFRFQVLSSQRRCAMMRENTPHGKRSSNLRRWCSATDQSLIGRAAWRTKIFPALVTMTDKVRLSKSSEQEFGGALLLSHDLRFREELGSTTTSSEKGECAGVEKLAFMVMYSTGATRRLRNPGCKGACISARSSDTWKPCTVARPQVASLKFNLISV